ncbi:MAG: peptidylprolyl isomerase [Flavobacteriales bacterium]
MRILFISALLFFATLVQAQTQTLMTIDGENVSVDEFLSIYNKKSSVKDTSVLDEKALREYLDLYIKFRLKVKEAEKNGLDTSKKFKDELAGYRKQLAESYMTDKEATEDLVKEAYERMKWDVHASHVLILCRPDDMPEDTLKAYQKAMQVYSKAKAGEDFGKLATEFSEDPSAKENKGDLGYFSAMRMVYAFESAAYNTPVGSVSKPVRTRFGYHVIKVHDKRPSVGEVKVAHIMIRIKENASDDELKRAELRIREIKTRLSSGEDFATLARVSEDYSSAQKGGELPFFGPYKYPKEFEDAAFALKEKGDISEPVKTDYGWHVIKLLDKKGLDSFEKMQPELKKNVARNERSNLSKEVVINRIKKDNKFKENPKNLKAIYQITDSTLADGNWKLPTDLSSLNKPLFTIGKEKYSQADFANYINTHQVGRKGNSYKQIVNQHYANYQKEKLLAYEDARLEEKYPKFKALMKEYRDGILLFEITDKNVWSKAVKDTAGLKEFYSQHKTDWMWGDRVKAEVFVCMSKEAADTVRAMLIRGPQVEKPVAKSETKTAEKKEKGKGKVKKEEMVPLEGVGQMAGNKGSAGHEGHNHDANGHNHAEESTTPKRSADEELIAAIIEKVNKNSQLNMRLYSGVYSKDEYPALTKVEWKKGITIVVEYEKMFYVFRINEVLPAQPKKLEEARGAVTAAYQTYLEETWLKQLKAKYPVQVNEEVFNGIIKKK